MFRLILVLALSASAVQLPTGGLPQGGSGAPLLALKPAAHGSWNILNGYAKSLGDIMPNGSAWSALDTEAGRLAAAPLLSRLPGTFWADVIAPQQPAARKAQLQEQFLAAYAAAALQAGDDADASLSALERSIQEGKASEGDLALLEFQLRGLSVYAGRAGQRYEQVRELVRRQQELAVGRALADGDKLRPKQGSDSVEAPSSESAHKPLLSKPVLKDTPSLRSGASRRLGKAATWAGVGLLGVSAAGFAQPGLLPVSEQLPGILTWAGVASLGAGRYFGAPIIRAAAAVTTAGWKLPEWLSKWLGSFTALVKGARASADAEVKLEAAVGDGQGRPFWAWVRAGVRSAVYWLPLSLLGMLVGSILSLPFQGWTLHASSGAPGASALTEIPFWTLLNGYGAGLVLAELALLGVGFRSARAVLGRWLGDGRAVWLAGLAALLASGALLLFTGYPLGLIPAVLGIEAVMIALYAKTRSLLAPGLARALFALAAVESTRMTAFLHEPVSGSLVGLPSWTALAVAGLGGLFLLAKPIKAQWARLRELGLWWSRPEPDGAPKRMGPMMTAGLLWAVPLFLSMDAVYRLIHWLVPQTEPVPEMLTRLLLMPVDIIIFNFIIVAALEEWVFRRGVFKPMVDRLKKWGAPAKWWFWPAAIVSSLIFSGAHYIDWSALLAQIGVGDPNVGASMAGAYAFTWASFLARTMGGVVMAGLYARSGSLLLPMIAHFGSNMLEGMGMRLGIWPFLAMTAAVLALQWWRGAKLPKFS